MQNFLKFLKFIFRILYNIMANDFVNEEYKDRLRTSARIGKKNASKNCTSSLFCLNTTHFWIPDFWLVFGLHSGPKKLVKSNKSISPKKMFEYFPWTLRKILIFMKTFSFKLSPCLAKKFFFMKFIYLISRVFLAWIF